MKKVFKNKKGFTLIELLAVIVILGVIMVIAVPAVTKYIDKSRKDGVESSAKMYVDAVNKMSSAGELTTENGSLAVKDLDVQLKSGQKPSNGWLDINDGIVERATLCIDKYSIKYENKNAKIVNDDYCNYEVTFEGNKTEVTGTTMVINKTLTTETNIMCTNGAIPSYSDGKINVTHVNGKTECGAYNSLKEAINKADTSTTNIVMMKDETENTATECNSKYFERTVTAATCIDNKNVILNMNNYSYKSSLNQTIYIKDNSKLKIIGNGYIGNDKTTTNSAAIVISGSKLYLNSTIADKCTENSIDTTRGLCLYGEYAVNNWPNTKYKNYTNINGVSTNGKIGFRNGGADIKNIYAISYKDPTISVWDTSETINIYGGEMTSSKSHTILNSQGSTGTINVMGGTINQTEVTEFNGAAIYNYTGTLNIKGGTIVTDRNTSVYNREGIANITGGTITSKQNASLYHDSGTTHISGNVKMSALGSANINARGGNLYINGGLFETKYQNISTNIWQNYSGGKVYICGGTFKNDSAYQIKMDSSSAHLYYKSTGIKWNDNLIPVIFQNDYTSNVILDDTIVCN